MHDRYLAKAQGSQKSVRVVSADGEEFAEPFDFYPWEKLTELGCIMGRGGNIRIPMRDEDWQDVGAGRHVRVAFKDGEDGIKHYLGVIAYETVSKGWHVFFEDDEEIDIKVCGSMSNLSRVLFWRSRNAQLYTSKIVKC